MIVILLVVFLVLALAFAFPAWANRTSWGMYPAGVILVALVILAIAYLMGYR